MFKKLFVLVFFFYFVALNIVGQQTTKKKEQQKTVPIYLFGVAQILVDSTVYMSEISELVGTENNKGDLLVQRGIYSDQFQNYIQQTYSVSSPSTTIFWDKSPQKIRKKYEAVKKHLSRNHKELSEVSILQISLADFQFQSILK